MNIIKMYDEHGAKVFGSSTGLGAGICTGQDYKVVGIIFIALGVLGAMVMIISIISKYDKSIQRINAQLQQSGIS